MVRAPEKPKELGSLKRRGARSLTSRTNGEPDQDVRLGLILDQRQGRLEQGLPQRIIGARPVAGADQFHHKSTRLHRARQPPWGMALISATTTS